MKLMSKRALAVVVAAVAIPVAFVPGIASAERGDRDDNKDYKTEVEASFTVDGDRYTIDARGDDDSGAGGTWRLRDDDGDRARGRVVCVAGDKLGNNDGNAAAIVVKITHSDVDGLDRGDFIKQFLWDSPGPDRHRIDFNSGRNCPEDGELNVRIRNTERVRGDIDVEIGRARR